MSEKPSLNVIEEGKSGLSDLQVMELITAREFILDSEDKPENWRDLVDEAHLHTLRQEIMHWDFDELMKYCQQLDVWEDPTKTAAVLDVIQGKTVSVLKKETALEEEDRKKSANTQ